MGLPTVQPNAGADRDARGGSGADRSPRSSPAPSRTPLGWPGFLPVVAVLSVAVVTAASAAPTGHGLVVADATTGDRLFATPVDDGTPVVLAYTHSVERTPVRDEYVVEDGRLVMTRMRFQSYGWGLPSRADVETVDGWFVTHPDWSGRALTVKPGREAGHRLVVGDRTYDLVARSDGGSVTIRIEQRSQLDRLLAVAGGGGSVTDAQGGDGAA